MSVQSMTAVRPVTFTSDKKKMTAHVEAVKGNIVRNTTLIRVPEKCNVSICGFVKNLKINMC